MTNGSVAPSAGTRPEVLLAERARRSRRTLPAVASGSASGREGRRAGRPRSTPAACPGHRLAASAREDQRDELQRPGSDPRDPRDRGAHTHPAAAATCMPLGPGRHQQEVADLTHAGVGYLVRRGGDRRSRSWSASGGHRRSAPSSVSPGATTDNDRARPHDARVGAVRQARLTASRRLPRAGVRPDRGAAPAGVDILQEMFGDAPEAYCYEPPRPLARALDATLGRVLDLVALGLFSTWAWALACGRGHEQADPNGARPHRDHRHALQSLADRRAGRRHANRSSRLRGRPLRRLSPHSWGPAATTRSPSTVDIFELDHAVDLQDGHRGAMADPHGAAAGRAPGSFPGARVARPEQPRAGSCETAVLRSARSATNVEDAGRDCGRRVGVLWAWRPANRG